jgi:hypothetical protein
MLSSILGNSKEIENVGELISGMRTFPRAKVSSGMRIVDDPFWARVIGQAEEVSGKKFGELAGILARYSSIARFPRFLFKPRIDALMEADAAVSGSIAAVSGKRVVMDASKEFTRAYYLLRNTEHANVVFLVRDISAVLNSTRNRLRKGQGLRVRGKNLKGRWLNGPLLLLAALFWCVGNAIGEAIARRFPGRVFRIRYEAFCEAPFQSLAELGAFLGVDLSDVAGRIEAGEELDIGRGVGGNHMRFEDTFVFNPSKGSVPKNGAYVRMLSVIALPFKLFVPFYR